MVVESWLRARVMGRQGDGMLGGREMRVNVGWVRLV